MNLYFKATKPARSRRCEDRLFELKEMYKNNCTKETMKEKEILQKESKNLRKHLTL